MSVIEELIRVESNGTISFGNYLLDTKKKIQDFEVNGDLYKVKTSKELSRLEKNGKLLYESVPGTTVHCFDVDEKITSFDVEGMESSQITLELEKETEYKLFIDDVNVGKIKTNISGKCSLSVEIDINLVSIRVEKI